MCAALDRILRLALVQMTSTRDRPANLDRAERLARTAASEEARMVALPENFSDLRSGGEPPPPP